MHIKLNQFMPSAFQRGIYLAAIAPIFLIGCGGGAGGAAVPDTSPPAIVSTSPANNSKGVAVNASISATFTKAMNSSTVTTANVTLNNGVTGKVNYIGTTATFTPSIKLTYSTVYTASISSGVSDVSNHAMASNYSWTFTTQPPPINDSGIKSSQCYQAGSDLLVACSSAGAIALNSAQDGMTGRDVSDGTISDGNLGFNFTAVNYSMVLSPQGECVQDNITGLFWESKTADGGLRDLRNTYTDFSASSNPLNQYNAPTDASGYVSAVNATKLCGFGDWRLPTVEELQSIVDFGAPETGSRGIAVDPDWFPTIGGTFWTASSDTSNSSKAWTLSFGNGDTYSQDRTQVHNVVLVRAGHAPMNPRYAISADGQEVTDRQTNLIWKRCSEGMSWDGSTCTGTATTFSHEAALQRASAQVISTGIAWRLPNVKELSSIIDRNYNNPAIDPTVFPSTPSSIFYRFWSSSPLVYFPSYAIGVNFGVSDIIASHRANVGYVRLVRDSQ